MVAPGHMKTRQTTDRSDGPHVAEVIRLHEVIAAWTTGEAANTDDSFRRFAGALAPGFMIVNPGGVAEDRESVVSRFRGLHGARAGRDFRIEIHQPAVRRETGDVTLVTYHEHWFEGAEEKSIIIATALLQPEPEAPGGLLWRHLHGSWLRPPVAQ